MSEGKLGKQPQTRLLEAEREAEVAAEIARTISASLDLGTVLQRVAEGAKELCGSDMSRIALREPESEAVIFRNWVGSRYQGYGTFRIEPGKGVGGQVLLTGLPFRTDGYALDRRISKDYLEVAREEGVVAELAVPIKIDGSVEGLLFVDNRFPRPFTDRDETILTRLADHAAIAIKNARLHEETRRQHQEAVALEKVAREITSSLERGEVFQRIVDQAREISGSDLAFLAPYDRESRTATIVAVSGARTEALMAITITRGRGTGGWVLESGEPFRTEDYLNDPRISKDYAEAAIKEGFISQAVVPLKFRGAITGLLWVTSRVPRRFTERDLAVLTKLADQAAIALENSRLYEELKGALQEVETSQQRIVQGERLRALGELAGGVAHDFNNVLAVIVGRAQLLLQQVDEPGLKRQLQVIEKVALDGARTVKRIQEFTRLRLAKPFQPVDVSRVVEEAVEITRSRWKDEAQAKDVHYDVMVETPHPVPAVLGEASELSEALVNIVLNALDAMPQGGRITIRTGVEGERVFVAVADTGIGMTEEVGRRVFDPFFTTKVARGSGLGLSVVYGIVKRHGGEIDVQSRVGEGSTFTVRLPVGRKIPEAPPVAPPSQPCRPAKILVIDDEDEIRNLLVDLLAGQGHAVVPCPDGQSGLARFREGRFDLVITDLGMPGMSGWEVARAIKLGRRETPVALITGWSEQIDPEEAKEKGADFLVAKPFKVREVLAVVTQALLRAERTSNV